MDHGIRPRSAVALMAGPAFPLRVHTADILMVAPALAACPPGHVLVIDGGAEPNTALWGGITTESAFRKKLAGVVIDGAIRDSAEIARSRLPVFARAVVPNAGGAEYAAPLNVPVSCGGVIVRPGDWLVGDADGVVVVPLEQREAIIEKAERIVAAEQRIIRQMRAGQDLATLIGSDAKLASKQKEELIPQLRRG